MEHKDYNLEIIEKLLMQEGHARGIARQLRTNHMLASRKLKDLSKLNVLDYKQVGKNKIYYIKNSIEAKSYILMAESYKLIRLLKKHLQLRMIIEKIQKDKKIKLAILFGSYVKGAENKDSDIDVYIETEDNTLKKDIETLSSKLSVKIGKYIRESELIKEIERNHVIIKGIEVYYEKVGFFN